MLYWIDLPAKGRLAIMARPRAYDWLEDEIAAWRRDGADMVVSLLEAGEVAELELAREEELCRRQGMDFMTFPIADRGVPASLLKATEVARSLAARLHAGEAVAIHCRAGIGRSSLIAACVLVAAGFGAEDAFAAIGRARGLLVPDTPEQRDWVMAFEADGPSSRTS